MTKPNAEFNLSDIPSETIRVALCETIENKLKTNKYKITVHAASKAGESNFVGIVHRVLFSKENEPEHVDKIIVKVAPQNERRRNAYHSRELFLQEIYMYDEILPILRDFEASKGFIVDDIGFNEYPKCYRSICEEPSECLLLEDLSIRGFSIIDRYVDDVTADHVYLVMKALAKLHAISFALKDQQPLKFMELASKLGEKFVRTDDISVREFFKKQSLLILQTISGEDDAHLLAIINKLFEQDPIDIAADCLDISFGAVITHGDTHQNNIMFKCDASGKPIDISLVDWQETRYSSPIVDIVFFMFCSTTKELRDTHYNTFLRVYHECLSAHIRRLGSDPEKLFPFSLMELHFRKFAKYGLILATIVLPIITTERGIAIDLDEIANDLENSKNADIFDTFISENSRNKFNKRMRDVVVDMVRLGYI